MDTDDLKAELLALRDSFVINHAEFVQSINYVNKNQHELREMLTYSNVADVADTVVDLIRSGCINGKCH